VVARELSLGHKESNDPAGRPDSSFSSIPLAGLLTLACDTPFIEKNASLTTLLPMPYSRLTMRTLSLTSLVMISLLLIGGCSANTPTQAADDSDGVVAEIVAAAAGYRSNGFAATVNDVAALSLGEKIDGSSEGELPSTVAASAPASAPLFDRQRMSLERRRSSGDLASRWHLIYQLRPLSNASIAAAHGGIAVEASSEGIFHNSRQRGQGESQGEFAIGEGSGERIDLGGKYNYEGSTTFRSGDEEHYADVRVTFNWSSLSVARRSMGEFRGIAGQVDVNVSANGPHGILSRNGRLIFNGTNNGTLLLGGKKYFIDMSSAQSVGRP
jgi:hypothetical protein